jgi:cob(I)alamin adenosyltransferase
MDQQVKATKAEEPETKTTSQMARAKREITLNSNKQEGGSHLVARARRTERKNSEAGDHPRADSWRMIYLNLTGNLLREFTRWAKKKDGHNKRSLSSLKTPLS